MKYLKKFEDHNDLTDLKKSDYVFVECDDYDLHDEMVILEEDPENTADGFVIKSSTLNGEFDPDGYTIYDHEIIRKAEPWEVAAIKYNL